MLFRSKKPTFSITIARGALESIFDECDKYDADETGGRLLGTYPDTRTAATTIEVKGVLEPGPNAQRSPTYFLQDGDHQERLFRAIEASHPEIEHLGNWHTHHVNGLPTLSGGDKTTYFKTVNHEKHNTDFFYALLVVSKNRGGNPRYAIKHFIFRRSDTDHLRDSARKVRLVDTPLLRPPCDRARRAARSVAARTRTSRARRIRSAPRTRNSSPSSIPASRRCSRRTTGAPYWKGPLSLVDGSHADVVAMEDPDGRGARPIRSPPPARTPVIADILRAVQGTASSARRGTPFCISNAISIRRFTAARRGKGI